MLPPPRLPHKRYSTMSTNQQSNPTVTGYPAPPPSNGCYPNTAPPPSNGYYPYTAPPPPYYTTTQNPQPYNNNTTIIRRIFAIIIASIIITGTVIFIVWLILRPRLPDFRVNSLSLTNFTLSNSSLVAGNWDVRFTVYNPNHKISIQYDHIEAAVYFGSDSISETTVPPFYQGTRQGSDIRATFAAAGAYVDEGVVEGINSERRSSGSVRFNVRILARVKLKAGWWRNRRRFLRVFCGDLDVGLAGNGSSSSSGSLTGGQPRQCREGM